MLGPISIGGDGSPGAVTGSGTVGQIAQWATATSLGSLALVPIALGGTNSSTALINNRVMISSGGKIVENLALLANNVVFANASGLPDGTTNFTFDVVASKLTANAALLLGGTTGSTPTSGAGTRFMWIPAKTAFRAGEVSGTDWNAANIGNYSFAFGIDIKITGQESAGFGDSHIIAGGGSYAFGNGANISTDNNYSFGSNNALSAAASGYGFALGKSNTVSGQNAFVFGDTSTASGLGASAIGKSITVSGQYSYGISLDTGGYTVSANNVMCVLGGRFSVGGVNPASGLEVAQNMSFIRVFVNGNITIGVNDNGIIYGVNTNAARSITLPDASDAGAGRYYIIKDEAGTGAATNNITINAAAGDDIDGAASFVMNVNRQSITLYSNGGLSWGVV